MPPKEDCTDGTAPAPHEALVGGAVVEAVSKFYQGPCLHFRQHTRE